MIKDLASEIFKSEVPEEYIKNISPQNLYFSIKKRGLESSAELLAIATPEQLQLLLDFDLWKKDQFNEDSFWDWLAVTDATDDLGLLHKIFRSFDLKIISLILGKYTENYFTEERTDEGEDGFYTPDRGYTWIRINMEDPDRLFYLGRLLALIYENNADLFYQLLRVQTITTLSILEEESYQDAIKRLNNEGIPDLDLACETNSEISETELKKLLSQENYPQRDFKSLEVIFWNNQKFKYFQELREIPNIESDLSFILNSAIVFNSISINEIDEITKLTLKVKGAINIGLEKLNLPCKEAYNKLGLVAIYRYGLTELNKLKKYINYKDKTKLENVIHYPEYLGIVAGVNQRFVEQPNYIENGKIISAAGELESGYKEISSLAEIEFIKNKLVEYFSN